MPLGMLYTISHLASLANIPVEWAIAAATGSNAEIYRLNSGYLRPGRDADVAVIDACAGGSQDNALDALRNGDITAVAAVVSDGVPRFVGRAEIRQVRSRMFGSRIASSRGISQEIHTELLILRRDRENAHEKAGATLAAALCLIVTAKSAPAQEWPRQPIHIIVSLGPGAAPTSSAASSRRRCRTGSASR